MKSIPLDSIELTLLEKLREIDLIPLDLTLQTAPPLKSVDRWSIWTVSQTKIPLNLYVKSNWLQYKREFGTHSGLLTLLKPRFFGNFVANFT